jgi:hypothetical protein
LTRWRKISHPNLTPVLDLSDISVKGRITFSVITPWATNGNVAQYLERNPEANRLKLVCLSTFPNPPKDFL